MNKMLLKKDDCVNEVSESKAIQKSNVKPKQLFIKLFKIAYHIKFE